MLYLPDWTIEASQTLIFAIHWEACDEMKQWSGWKVGKAAQENMPEGSGSLRIRMSKEENKGRVLVIMAVLFCGFLGGVRISSEEGGKLCGYVEDVSSGWEKKDKEVQVSWFPFEAP